MSVNHGLILDEGALARVPDSKKAFFILDWLRCLNQTLLSAQNSDIRDCQKLLVEQLTREIHNSPGPPTRKLLGKCLSTLFAVGDTFLVFETVNKCNDILKNKDDSPSFLPTKLSAICCIGIMYEKLGRLMGRSYEETVTLLLKTLKNAEMIVAGMGSAASSLHRDIFKSIKHGMVDRVLVVRANAALCLNEMVNHAPFLYTAELETVFSLCFRSLEGSNYEVRCRVSHVLGSLVAITQLPTTAAVGKNRLASLDEVLALLATGFLRGGMGFLKSNASEMIKGSVISRETRVGVTHSYVVLASILGNTWLEKNLSFFITHLLELLGNPKAAPSHMDAVYSRRCVAFVLRFALRRQLNEKAQAQAIKELVFVLNKYVNAGVTTQEAPIDSSNGTKDAVTDPSLVQHILICALQELGCLIEDLGTSASSVVNDQSLGLVDTVASILVHSSPAARLSSAWCLRCIAVATPSQLTPLIERCLERLETMKTSPETIYGYSFALAALLGSASQTPLGIPHNKGKLIFSIAEDLLRSASQNSRLSLQRTQSGWQLIAAVMTLGPPVVRGLLPRMLLLWKNCFPRSSKELESEKARGDAFTWQITLENRAGALGAMSSFLTFCHKLVTEEIVRRILGPVESAVTMLTMLSSVFRNYGPTVKASAAMVRYRLYETLLLLPAQSYDGSYTNLLRLLVAEFTLSDNAANTTTSLLRTFCHSDDDVILGSWLQETDHKSIEDQVRNLCMVWDVMFVFGYCLPKMEPSRSFNKDFLQPNSTSGCGALEHDISNLYKPLKEKECHPWSLPLGVEVINKSCLVFGHIFRFVANKHRLQMLTHFQECIKHSKGTRQEAVQVNILTAVVIALKTLSENKSSLGTEENKNTLTALLASSLSHQNPLIRCACAQSLGRLGQIVADGRYVAHEAQLCFDKLKSSRDALSRTGHSLALGYLHRYVGSLGSSQHLNTSISILLALSQDSTSSAVQVWALHALTLIADSGGPNFRPYVEPCLAQSLKLLTTIPFYSCDVHQCIGKLLSAVITAIGPELQANSVCAARNSLLLACAVMQEHDDPLVQTEAINCIQQLHMFAPKYVNHVTLVPILCNALQDRDLFLRRAAVSCLHQLTQCEPREVCNHVCNWLKETKRLDVKRGAKSRFQVDHGLPGILFTLLDIETDTRLITDVQKIMISLVQVLVIEDLHLFLTLCKEVLTSTESGSNGSTPEKEVENDPDFEDDESTFKAEEATSHIHVQPRWKTKVFATQTLCRIICACESVPDAKVHFDLQLARERKLQSRGKEDFLILHLSELIRMSFMTATSDSDPLRLEGLKALELIIEKFSKVSEPEFPEHVVLEQYQAQVGAALRPAFSSDTPSHVTAIACQVCSAWIGSGVARDLNDLRRVHQLLVSSLSKLRKDSSSRLYNESASTLEKLAILKAWAEVYVVAMEEEQKAKTKLSEEADESDDYNSGESLLHLVKPELKSLSGFWLAALKDHALLTLPPEFSNQLPHDGGAFYTSDTVELTRPQYRSSWPPILHAAALWLCTEGFETDEPQNEENKARFHLLFGICMEALCNPKSSDPLTYVVICLKSLETLFSQNLPRTLLAENQRLAVELCNVLHRLLLTRETIFCQRLVLSIAELVVKAEQEKLESDRKKIQRELAPANQKIDDSNTELAALGDGDKDGLIVPGESVVYSLMELCLYVLVRQLPNLSPTLANTPAIACTLQKQGDASAFEENMELIGKCVRILAELPEICSPKGSTAVLPTVLYLITGVEKEIWCQSDDNLSKREPILSVLKALERLVSSTVTKNAICEQEWIEHLRTSFAGILDSCKTSKSLSLYLTCLDCEISLCFQLVWNAKLYGDGQRPNEIVVLLTIETFLTKAPLPVIQIPNFQYPCINLFKHSMQSSNPSIQLCCFKSMKAIFSRGDYNFVVPYIHALAPKLITTLGQEISECCSTDVTLSKTKCEKILAGLETFESLIALAANDKLSDMLGLYLPLLISLLSDNINNLQGKPNKTLLHKYALEKLTNIGQSYPQEFRQVIGKSSRFRQKLETAIRSQQDLSNGLHNTRPAAVNREQEHQSQNTIKLKTDFSNYS